MDIPTIVGLSGFVALIVLIMLGIPVFVVMMVVSIVGFCIISGPQVMLLQLGSAPYTSAENYVFAVIPLFMLMGELISQTGLGEITFVALNKWLGKIRGGLLMATIVANAVFGAVSAAPVSATILSIRVALPELKKNGYKDDFCVAGFVAASTLAALIPPSTPILIFCILTGVPIGRALVAGVGPGITLTIIYCITIAIYGRLYPERIPKTNIQATWKEKCSSILPIYPIAVLFLIIIGGIYFGFFPPTVGGAIGAMSTLIYAIIRRTSSKKIINAFREVCTVNCQVFPMMIAGFIFARFTAVTRLADSLTTFVTEIQAPPLIVMCIVIVIYILISFPMELMPAMIITLPIFFPLLTAIGFSPYVVVVVLVLLITMANFTPPTGTAIYVASSLAEINVVHVFKSVVPWFIATFIFILIVILYPPLTTWLPSLIFN